MASAIQRWLGLSVVPFKVDQQTLPKTSLPVSTQKDLAKEGFVAASSRRIKAQVLNSTF
jgi:hypothetical protein